MCYLKKKNAEAGSNKSESEDSIYVPFACEDCKCGDQPALQEIEDIQNLSISSTPMRMERPGMTVSERATPRPRRAAPSVAKVED